MSPKYCIPLQLSAGTSQRLLDVPPCLCRHQGFRRLLLQASEVLCRGLGILCMLLCSLNDIF